MKRIILLLGIFVAGCGRENLRSGDLLFQAGDSDFTEAITSVTEGSWSHVGIVEQTSEGIFILEATPDQGVVRSSLQAFLDDAASDKDGHPAVKAFRVTGMDRRGLKEAVSKAGAHLGKAYDFAFLPGTEKIYCSELVYESYRKADGSPFFRANPMTFKDSTGETSPYWSRYYEQLGCGIPEGLPGTNPNDLSRDPHLKPLDWKP
jgi:uncharacterized protein YycO